MVTTQELAKAFINSHHGWAVADQFDSIYEDSSDGNMSEQNFNALRYIEEALTELVEDSDVLSDDAAEDLYELRDNVRNFLAELPNMEKNSQ